MERRANRVGVMLMSVGMVLMASQGWADIVCLKSGRILEGEILEEAVTYVRIKTEKTVYRIPRKLMMDPSDFEKLPLGRIVQRKDVVVFVAPWCHHCHRLEQFLKTNRIVYRRMDIETDRQAKQEFSVLKGKSLPVVLIDGQVIQGYHPEQILMVIR
jgi:glutaredoxin